MEMYVWYEMEVGIYYNRSSGSIWNMTQFRGDLNLTVHVLCVPVLYITKYACVVVCVLL